MLQGCSLMWQVISIFLQAAGVLLLLWTLVGWLVLGRDRGGMAVFTCRGLWRRWCTKMLKTDMPSCG